MQEKFKNIIRFRWLYGIVFRCTETNFTFVYDGILIPIYIPAANMVSLYGIYTYADVFTHPGRRRLYKI